MINENVGNLRAYLKNKLLSKSEFSGYEKERAEIFNLLKCTVDVGESNSALLIGPRGVGKSTLVNGVIEELKRDANFEKNAIMVNLHGLIHTDDRLALMSITNQMNLDTVVDGKVFGSFAENLGYLLGCLRTGNKSTSKSVLFIIEEFDLFCSHHNQTLLYNLFDTSQSAQAPICVLGITCRLDVIELLEKRVKSRFSHRQYFLFPGEDDVDAVLVTRLNRIKELLNIKDCRGLPASYLKKWNSNINQLINDNKFKSIAQRQLDINCSETLLKTCLMSILSALNETKEYITIEDFEEEMCTFEKDDIVEQLLDLSILEMCLLISMKHHWEIYDGQPMNFEMVFTRYMKFVNVSTNIQSVQRPVVMKAFEHIQNLELIQFMSGTNTKLQKEYQMFKLQVLPQQIKEAVNKWPGMPTEVAQWAISSLI